MVTAKHHAPGGSEGRAGWMKRERPVMIRILAFLLALGLLPVMPETAAAQDSSYRLKAGDVVLFGKYAGTEITVEGEEVIILRESDILARIG